MDQARQILDRRLNDQSGAPLVVAFSGGSDSLALLRLVLDWARPHGRPVLAVTVDHGLQAQSAAWTDRAGALAVRLGARCRAMRWTGPKPSAGVPAAARAARHRLLARAARDAGAEVILMGHTADDLRESLLMRRTGCSLPLPAQWSPSPVWPEGRGLFLARPLLGCDRAQLRARLLAEGLEWLDDPANDDPRYARARARAALATTPRQPPPTTATLPPGTDRLARGWVAEPWGGLRADRARLRRAPPAAAVRVLQAAIACASGAEAPPRRAGVEALLARLGAEGPVVAVLAGARIEADAATVAVMREAGELRRGGRAPEGEVGEDGVWDGRFELSRTAPCGPVGPLAGRSRWLSSCEHRVLRTIPAAARGGLPAWRLADGRVTSPILAGPEGEAWRALHGRRLLGACGVIAREV